MGGGNAIRILCEYVLKSDVVSTIIFVLQLAKHHLTVYALFKSPGIHFLLL